MSIAEADVCLWNRYKKYLFTASEGGFSVDVSRVRFSDEEFTALAAMMRPAFDAMERLEGGAIANTDEGRMVGHYWLRAPGLAPTESLQQSIRGAVEQVHAFAERLHTGDLARFTDVIHIGIGGSTSGPQLVCHALRNCHDRVTVHFLDNSDPDGIDSLMDRLEGRLDRTLVSVVSKCGYTPTPQYVHLELEAIFHSHGLDFNRHAVATTVEGSDLDRRAIAEGWLARFPMWDWVGGRTSVTSVVGLLPLALQGAPIDQLLDGAADMDVMTRTHDLGANPAALLAAMWFWLGDGRGAKNMVVLPYKDRLALLPKYVQQLVMESVGKKLDRDGREVRQGLTVYGNKGSTDQHSYFQQLRDGPNDFFVTFIQSMEKRSKPALEIMTGVTLDDYLFGSAEGSRNALHDRGRSSITITLPDISARSLGMLIALFERAVCLYAELIHVNAYSQPGVDKRVADPVVHLQQQALRFLREGSGGTAEEIARGIDRPEQVEMIYKLLKRLANQSGRRVVCRRGKSPFEETFSLTHSGGAGAEAY